MGGHLGWVGVWVARRQEPGRGGASSAYRFAAAAAERASQPASPLSIYTAMVRTHDDLLRDEWHFSPNHSLNAQAIIEQNQPTLTGSAHHPLPLQKHRTVYTHITNDNNN